MLLLGALPAAAGSLLVYAAAGRHGRAAAPRAAARADVAGEPCFRRVRPRARAGDPGARRTRPGGSCRSSDKAAGRIARFAVAIAAIIAAGKTLEALNQAIVAALPLTVLARGVFALAAALTLAELLRRFATTTSNEEASLGPYIPTEAEAGAGPVRIVGWTAVADR